MPEAEGNLDVLQQRRRQDTPTFAFLGLVAHPIRSGGVSRPQHDDAIRFGDGFLDDLMKGTPNGDLPVPPNIPPMGPKGLGYCFCPRAILARVTNKDICHFVLISQGKRFLTS